MSELPSNYSPPALPSWLTFTPEEKPKARRSKEVRELWEMQYPAMFEHYLSRIEQGHPLMRIMKEDLRGEEYAFFNRWIHSNPERKRRLYEAQQMATEVIAGEVIEIADAEDSLEDVSRSALRIRARQFVMAAWNRRRYGESKSIEIGTVSVSQALDEARGRLLEAEVVDVEEDS